LIEYAVVKHNQTDRTFCTAIFEDMARLMPPNRFVGVLTRGFIAP
jgi:hypothetical protein